MDLRRNKTEVLVVSNPWIGRRVSRWASSTGQKGVRGKDSFCMWFVMGDLVIPVSRCEGVHPYKRVAGVKGT